MPDCISPGDPKRCVIKWKLFLVAAPLYLTISNYTLVGLMIPAQNTYGHTQTQNTHANISQPLYGHTHIYTPTFVFGIVTLNHIIVYDLLVLGILDTI